MKEQVEFTINKKEISLINIEKYFQIPIEEIDYIVLSQFSKINSILDKMSFETILNEDKKIFTLKPNLHQKPKIKKEERTFKIIPNSQMSNISGLESKLSNENQFITNINRSYTPSSNYIIQKKLDYRLSKQSYPRKFTWYDIPKQNIISAYYKRH